MDAQEMIDQTFTEHEALQQIEAHRQLFLEAQRLVEELSQPYAPRPSEDIPRTIPDLPQEDPSSSHEPIPLPPVTPRVKWCKTCNAKFQYKTDGMASIQLGRHEKSAHGAGFTTDPIKAERKSKRMSASATQRWAEGGKAAFGRG